MIDILRYSLPPNPRACRIDTSTSPLLRQAWQCASALQRARTRFKLRPRGTRFSHQQHCRIPPTKAQFFQNNTNFYIFLHVSQEYPQVSDTTTETSKNEGIEYQAWTSCKLFIYSLRCFQSTFHIFLRSALDIPSSLYTSHQYAIHHKGFGHLQFGHIHNLQWRTSTLPSSERLRLANRLSYSELST